MTDYTDYYDLLETAVMEFIRVELASYFPKPEETVTKSDDTYLDQGHDYFCFIFPGAFPTGVFGNQIITVEWEVILDVFARYNTNEAQAWKDFKQIRGEVFNLFNVRKVGRTINGHSYVTGNILSADDRPRFIPQSEGDPETGIAFIGQAMTLTVTQRINKS